MIFKFVILSLALIYAGPSFAFDHNYGLWKRVIAQHVDYTTVPASVDYLAIKNKRLDFTENLQEMVKVTEDEYKAFTIDQRKAFLLNLYGAIAIKAVLDQINGQKLPVSIKAATRILNDIFDKKIFKLFDKKRSLNYIEQDLAQEFKSDFKFMVAFACAAKGCPPPGYYTADNLTKALNDVMKSFLSWDKNVNYTMATNTFVACDYFEPREKYMKYSKEYSSLKDFLIRNAPVSELLKDKALKNESSLDLDFSKMDWALNVKR
jgi:hypothetical protein